MLACTETSRADAGSSQMTRCGSPANARAIATRCFWPPESSVGLWKRNLGSTRTSAESLSTLARTEPSLAPPSLRTARVRIWRVLQAGLSVESGFWKTIWMARRASCERLPALALSTPPSKVMVPESGGSRPVTHLASVVLPLPDSPTRPKVSPFCRLRETSATAVSCLRPSLNVRTTLSMSRTSLSPPRSSRLVARTGVVCGMPGVSAQK